MYLSVCSQVIAVTTAQMPDVDWYIEASKHFELLTSDTKQLHTPEVTDNFAGLHSVRPILEIQFSEELW